MLDLKECHSDRSDQVFKHIINVKSILYHEQLVWNYMDMQ